MAQVRAPKIDVVHLVSYVTAIFILLISVSATAQISFTGQQSTASATSAPHNVLFNPSNPPLFLPAVTYGSGGKYSTAIAVADLNGDGKPDLVVANWASSTVGVLLGNGNGTFGPAASYDAGGAPSTVTVADVNGDGKPDLLVGNCGPSPAFSCPASGGSVTVLLGNGDGTFQPALSFGAGGSSVQSIAAADVNGDGKPDLLIATCNAFSLAGAAGVLLGNGDGTFRPVVTYDPGARCSSSIAVADVNGDGKPDLVVTNTLTLSGFGGVVSVLIGNGDGTFESAVTYGSGGDSAAGIAIADVNGDKKPDLLVAIICADARCEGNAGNGLVGVLLGNGDGTFQPAVTYDSAGESARSLAVGDVNGDGRSDVVVANLCSNSQSGCPSAAVGVLLGNGDGTFQPVISYASGGFLSYSVAIADVNRDGSLDVVVAYAGSTGTEDSRVGVLLNQAQLCTTPPAITLSATPKSLWPPTGRMAPVTISGTITNSQTGCSITTAAYVVTDEYGKVQPSGALTLGPGGAYSFTTWLQASRLGTDLDGRQYTITVGASNNAGKIGSQSGTVTVPHDYRQ